MGVNGYQGQIRAIDQPQRCFKANAQLMTLINANNVSTKNIKRLGIISTPGTQVQLNDQVIEIGKTRIYEVDNIEISSIKFLQDSSEGTYIDYLI